MELPDNINQVRVEIKIYDEYLTHTFKVQTSNNTKTTIKNIDNKEYVYFRSKYVIRVYLPVIMEHK